MIIEGNCSSCNSLMRYNLAGVIIKPAFDEVKSRCDKLEQVLFAAERALPSVGKWSSKALAHREALRDAIRMVRE